MNAVDLYLSYLRILIGLILFLCFLLAFVDLYVKILLAVLFSILVWIFYYLIALIYDHLQFLGQIIALAGGNYEGYLAFLLDVENFLKKSTMALIFSGVYLFLLILADLLA